MSLTQLRPPGVIRVRIIESETEESRARAKAAQETERAEGMARLLAHFSGIEKLDAEDDDTKQHFAMWGWIAVRGSALGAEQFHCGVATQRAAQAAHDCDAHQEQYVPLDLMAKPNQDERRRWSVIATRAVTAYLKSLGRCFDSVAHVVGTEARMQELEGRHADARRI